MGFGHISRWISKSKRYRYLSVYSSIIYNSQDMKSKCLLRYLDKEDVIHTHKHNGILLSHKMNETVPFSAICVDLEMIIISEASQRERQIYHLHVESKILHK